MSPKYWCCGKSSPILTYYVNEYTTETTNQMLKIWYFIVKYYEIIVRCTQLAFFHLPSANFSTDPSMTVRADVTGRYANRMYAYEPSDIKLCKCCSPYAVTRTCITMQFLSACIHLHCVIKHFLSLPQWLATCRKLRSFWSLSCEHQEDTLMLIHSCFLHSLHMRNNALEKFFFSPSLEMFSPWIPS